eukprot:gene2677-3321_t
MESNETTTTASTDNKDVKDIDMKSSNEDENSNCLKRPLESTEESNTSTTTTSTTTTTTTTTSDTNKKQKLDNNDNNRKIKKEEDDGDVVKDDDDDEIEDEEEDGENGENNNKKERQKNHPVRPPKLPKEELEKLQVDKVTTKDSKKKKVVLLIGYSGANYKGMQKNPGLETVEEELENGIFKAGGITPENFYSQQKIGWVRCARTDKGVSALRNTVSLKLEYGPPDLETMRLAINKHLPNDIRVFAIQRVNNSFHAKNSVDARSYIYVTPTHVFQPKFAKTPQTEEFKFTEKVRAQVNKVLSFFVGNHRYHNYTSGKDSTDVAAFRKIHSFTCSEPFVIKGIEVVQLNIVGASFMLHQIRKMVGCAISFLRKGFYQDMESEDAASEAIRQFVEATFAHRRFNLPMAPGAGLLLDRCLFTIWNQRYASIHGSLNFDAKNEEIEKFKTEVLFNEIVSKEVDNLEFKNWIENNLDPYPLPYDVLKEIYDNPPAPPPRRNQKQNNTENGDTNNNNNENPENQIKSFKKKKLTKKELREMRIQSKKFVADPKKSEDGNDSNTTTSTTTTENNTIKTDESLVIQLTSKDIEKEEVVVKTE